MQPKMKKEEHKTPPPQQDTATVPPVQKESFFESLDKKFTNLANKIFKSNIDPPPLKQQVKEPAVQNQGNTVQIKEKPVDKTGQKQGMQAKEKSTPQDNNIAFDETDTNHNTQYTSRTLNETENSEEKKKEEDELFAMLFKTKEIDLRGGIDMKGKYQRLDADMIKDAFEIKFKDNNGRIILHRAALEQRPDTLRLTFQNIQEQNSQLLERIINQKDNYGNTPLLLSCVYNNDVKRHEKLEVVKILLSKGANPNSSNPNTLWTTLHWAARYGDTQVITALLQNGAKPYIPDKKGYYPIDYAGQFKHVDAVKLFIKHTLNQHDKEKRKYQTEEQWEQYLTSYVDRAGRIGRLNNEPGNPLLQFNPLFHTSILYWASMFDKVEISLMQEVLTKLEAYPEGPIAINHWKTPCHAAAYTGNNEKLKILLTDINARYNQVQRVQGQAKVYSKNNICPLFKNRWNVLLKQAQYRKVKKFNDLVFEMKLNQYKSMTTFTFDLEDQFANTPLHLASQKGNDLCAQMLIEEYKCKLDTRNIEGWMPKDLVQNDKIKKVYKNFYKKLDKKLDESVSGARLSNAVAPNDAGPDEENQRQLVVHNQEKIMIDRELIKCREIMPKVPQLALKVNIKESAVINNMVLVLQNSGFKVQMFQALDPDFYYIALELEQEKLERAAKDIGFRSKLVDIDMKREFDPIYKEKFEPFRSKDIQTIMCTVIQKLIDTQQLITQKILISIIPMHDFYGIHEIRRQYENKYRCIPQPFAIIRQMYKEGMNFKFIELSAIKNYFGEKIGFYFVWMSFYTNWLVIPGILSFALTIYQIVTGLDSAFTVLYAVLVCLWVTIMMERWKRKSTEVAMKWGIFDRNKEQKQIRPEFSGDEFFSHVTHEVDKKNRSIKGMIILILSLPFLLGMIALCMAVFFLTKKYKAENMNGDPDNDRIVSIVTGIINSFCISFINFTYQKLAILFVKLENLKYMNNYESSFTFKLFIFKFINTNFSLFYTAFVDRNYISLYYLLVGMIIQKSIQVLIFKGPVRFLTQWLARRSYFNKVQKLAKEQQILHNNFIEGLDMDSQMTIKGKLQEQRSKVIYNGLDDIKNLPYQRIIFNTELNVEEQQVLIDAVELNSLMPPKAEIINIMETSEVFIIFGLATLYAAVCPIITFLVMVHNIFDIKLDLQTLYLSLRRPLQQSRSNIGPWLPVAQFMAITAVVSNCLLLYITSPSITAFFEDNFQVVDSLTIIWVLIGIEHVIITIKFFCSEIIKDHPSWVSKAFHKIKHELQSQMIEEAEKDENEKIDILKAKLHDFESKNKDMLLKMKTKVKSMKEDLAKKDQMLKDIAKDRAMSSPSQSQMNGFDTIQKQSTLQKINDEVSLAKKGETKLVDFLGLASTEWLAGQRINEVEKALTRNVQLRLFTQTFNKIEKEILTRRITKLYDTKKQAQINCVECSTSQAVIECTDCQDHFCKVCSESVHSSSHIFSLHNQIQITLEPPQKFSLFTKSQQNDVSIVNQPKKQNFFQPNANLAQLTSQWKKFEYFNFPLQPGNDLYMQIQQNFAYLRQQYIESNYIEGQDKIDYTSLFVDQQYDLLTEKQGKILMTKNQKKFGTNKQLPVTKTFNDEELYYMNRIAFYLFRHKGEHLTFANFTNRLHILQNETFQKKVTIWLAILDDKGEDMIYRSQIIDIVRVSFVQDLNQALKDEDIVNLIFGQDNQNEKMPIGQVMEAIHKNETVKAFMRCILQCSNQEA